MEYRDNRCFWTDLNNVFFFDLEIWWEFQIRYIVLSLKWLSGPKKSKFLISLFMDRFEFFFFFDLEFDGYSKSDIVLSLKWLTGPQKSNFVVSGPIEVYLKWLTGPQKFVIMIRCKINFDIIWYTVIFAANLYLSIFVWSSHILNFVFMNAVILVII